MSRNDLPNFEQHGDFELPRGWLDPAISRVATVFKRAAGKEMSLSEIVNPPSDLMGTEYVVELISDEGIVASVWQVEIDGSMAKGFGFSFTGQHAEEDAQQPHSVDFLMKGDNSVDVSVTISPEGIEDVLAPSQAALPLMRRVNDSLDGLLTAWTLRPEEFGVALTNYEGELFSEEVTEQYQVLLAKMLGIKNN